MLAAEVSWPAKRPRLVDPRLEGMDRSAQARRSRAPRRCRRRARRCSAPASASASTAVDGCVPLMSASPSFGRERASGASGPRRDRERDAAPRHRVAARGRRRQPRLRRSARARGARAARGRRSRRPIRGDGTRGCTPRFSSAISASSVVDADAGEPLAPARSRAAPSSRARRARAADRPTPAAWLRSRLSCSALERVGRDADLGEGAEAGVDAVDRLRRRRARDRRRARAARRERAPRRPARPCSPRVGDGASCVERERAAVEGMIMTARRVYAPRLTRIRVADWS